MSEQLAPTDIVVEISDLPKQCPWCGSHAIEADSRDVHVELGEYLADLSEDELEELGVDAEHDDLDRFEEEGHSMRYVCQTCEKGFISW